MFCNETINEVLKIFRCYRESSGLKVNYDKTEILRLGSIKNTDAKFFTQDVIRWTNETVKVLGITLSTNLRDITKLNIDPKIESIIKTWGWRKLTPYGKVTIINSLLTSQLVYASSVLPSPKSQLLCKIDKTLFNYLWDKKPHRLKKRVMINKLENGGIKMVDVGIKDTAMKAAWVQRVFQCKDRNEGFFGLEYYTKVDIDVLFKCNLSEADIEYCWKKRPSEFWVDVLKAWARYNFKKKCDCLQFNNEYLWLNSNIRVSGKPVIYKEFIEKGILHVADIKHTTGRILTFTELIEKYR